MSLFAKFEHGMYQNPKIIGLSDRAFRAYVESILWAGQHLTDGFLDERIVARFWGVDVADELCGNDPVNPSWLRVDGGWLIYGFAERQTMKADVEELRMQRRSAANARWDAKRMQTVCKTDAKPMLDTDTDIDTDIEPIVKRGTRLSTDFVVTDEMRLWAKNNCPWVDVDFATDSFRDYWDSVPGAKGVKLDWVKTWRNWIRNQTKSKPVSEKPTPTRTASDASQFCVHGWPHGECVSGC